MGRTDGPDGRAMVGRDLSVANTKIHDSRSTITDPVAVLAVLVLTHPHQHQLPGKTVSLSQGRAWGDFLPYCPSQAEFVCLLFVTFTKTLSACPCSHSMMYLYSVLRVPSCVLPRTPCTPCTHCTPCTPCTPPLTLGPDTTVTLDWIECSQIPVNPP